MANVEPDTHTIQDDELYSKMTLGTMKSPGKLTLSGHDRTKDWNVAKAKGQTGASSTLNGDPLGEFTARFDLYDAQDLAEWDIFQRVCESTVNGPKPVALPCFHPDLAANRYTEIVLRKMGGKVRNADGSVTVTVVFGEHKPPKPKPPAKATAKPAQTLATTDEGSRSPPKEDPNAAAKRELASLREEAARP